MPDPKLTEEQMRELIESGWADAAGPTPTLAARVSKPVAYEPEDYTVLSDTDEDAGGMAPSEYVANTKAMRELSTAKPRQMFVESAGKPAPMPAPRAMPAPSPEPPPIPDDYGRKPPPPAMAPAPAPALPVAAQPAPARVEGTMLAKRQQERSFLDTLKQIFGDAREELAGQIGGSGGR